MGIARLPTRFVALGLTALGWIAFSVTALCIPSIAWAEKSAVATAMEAVTAESLQAHVNALAADMYEGREMGSRGGRAAGGYIGQVFQKLELRGGAADGGYYQAFSGNGRNVLGVLEGSDPELKKQFVLVGAHYDHVGYGNRQNSLGPIGHIHNGADDNASGVAGLLELAAACRKLPKPLRRSVLFALWDGEEKGLFGSKHWVQNPTRPLNQIVLAVNMDMIGRLRNNRLEVLGTRTAPGLRQIFSQQNPSKLVLDFNWEMKSDSDHWSFIERNVPTVMLHTGLHDDYHKPSDDAEKINSAGMRQVVSLLAGTVAEFDALDRPPAFRARGRSETPSGRNQAERALAPPPPRLGLSWDLQTVDQPGLKIAQVTSGSAAARAGLRVGDVIELIDDEAVSVKDSAVFRARVLSAKDRVTLAVRRATPGALPKKDTKETVTTEAKPTPVVVVLTGKPTRFGLGWREDEAEPRTVIVNQIVAGSPAAEAGLRSSDRIYKLNGEGFAGGVEFGERLRAADAAVELEVETHGRVRQVKVEPLTLGK